MLTIVPAYGRDYKTEEKAVADWNNDKDFKIADVSSPYNGRYINLQDAQNDKNIKQVKIRYNKLADFVIVNV